MGVFLTIVIVIVNVAYMIVIVCFLVYIEGAGRCKAVHMPESLDGSFWR